MKLIYTIKKTKKKSSSASEIESRAFSQGSVPIPFKNLKQGLTKVLS